MDWGFLNLITLFTFQIFLFCGWASYFWRMVMHSCKAFLLATLESSNTLACRPKNPSNVILPCLVIETDCWPGWNTESSLESKQTQGQTHFIFKFLIPFVFFTVMALLGNKCLSLFVKYKVSFSHQLEVELCVSLYLQSKDYYFLMINVFHILIIHYYFLILLQVLHFFSA